MKKKTNLVLDLFCMLCYGLCGAIWLHKAFTGGRGFDGIVGFVWLIGAVIWAFRAVREFRETSRETTDETNHV